MFALKGFSESDFEVLRRYLTRQTATKDQVVMEAGKPALQMFLIEEGSVKIVQRLAKDAGDDVVLGAVKAGGFFGEEALLGEQQIYANTAVSMENTTLVTLGKEGLQKLMVEAMGVGTKLLLALTKSYREALATPEQMAKVLTFYSPKGGTGCTTLAVSFACQLARLRKRVAYIDADLQFGNVSLLIGAPPALNLARLLQKETSLTFDRIKGYLHRKHEVDFLFSPDQPQEAEMISRSNLNQVLQAIGRQYDFIVVDTSSQIDDHTLLLWDMADVLALVTNADLPGMTRMHRLFKVMGRLNYPKTKFALLANRFRDGQEACLAELRKLPVGHVQTLPADHANTQAAVIAGVPLALQAPASPVTRALEELLRYLLGEEAIARSQQKGGIFSRLKTLIAGA